MYRTLQHLIHLTKDVNNVYQQVPLIIKHFFHVMLENVNASEFNKQPVRNMRYMNVSRYTESFNCLAFICHVLWLWKQTKKVEKVVIV